MIRSLNLHAPHVALLRQHLHLNILVVRLTTRIMPLQRKRPRIQQILLEPTTVPLLAMRFAEALVAAGLPAGVLNLVVGPGSLGTALVQSPGVDAMSL